MTDMSRRNLILGAGGMLGLAAVAEAAPGLGEGDGGGPVPLWPGPPPGGGGPGGPVQVGATGAVSNVAVPALEVYRPQRAGWPRTA